MNRARGAPLVNRVQQVRLDSGLIPVRDQDSTGARISLQANRSSSSGNRSAERESEGALSKSGSLYEIEKGEEPVMNFSIVAERRDSDVMDAQAIFHQRRGSDSSIHAESNESPRFACSKQGPDCYISPREKLQATPAKEMSCPLCA